MIDAILQSESGYSESYFSDSKESPISNQTEIFFFDEINKNIKKILDESECDFAIRNLIALLNSGALKYPKCESLIKDLAQNIIHVIKTGNEKNVSLICLLIVRLSRDLNNKFEIIIGTEIINHLFLNIENNLPLISLSCRYALLNIARCCPTKNLVSYFSVNNGCNQYLAAQAFCIILSSWKKSIIKLFKDEISKSLIALILNQNKKICLYARKAMGILLSLFPKMGESLTNGLDEAQTQKVIEEIGKNKNRNNKCKNYTHFILNNIYLNNFIIDFT